MKKTVIELFAGVGGFRVGLNAIAAVNINGRAIENGDFNFVWANQWEPSTKIQPAFSCYVHRFGKADHHVNKDISSINAQTIPDHNLLVGGFPCQDYSVARTKSGERGIQGKKGVLWWEIARVLEDKRPAFMLLENVDRLLKSPANQRGRDFGIMLKTLSDLGYMVEWRVINAAEYGHPQKRRRVFIFAAHNNTRYHNRVLNQEPIDVINNEGVFSQQFPIDRTENIETVNIFDDYNDIVKISNKFTFQFNNSGLFINNTLTTAKYYPIIVEGLKLKDILVNHVESKEYFLSQAQINKFKTLKGSKRIPRKRPDGSDYFYSEGKMSFPDKLDSPGRTMLTSEGSSNRSTHVVADLKTNRIRKLIPIECERLNQFPDNWTDTGMTKNQRYFMMGNALVCGVVRKIGNAISLIMDQED